MQENEIIKELQCASEWFTQHGSNTNTAIIGICGRAVDLIKNQKAEIERLEAEVDKQYEQAEANILANIADGGMSCHWCIDKHKAEAIKDFAERLKELINPDWCKIHQQIDNLVKEMTGEQE